MSWFDENYFASQKIAQMRALGQEIPAGDTPLAQLNAAIKAYNDEHGTNVTIFSNFEACNTANYNGVNINQVNVSPNEMFNVEEYLQALADYNNENPDAYEGQAPAGGWTVQNELTTIFNTYHSSVWNHYSANWDTLKLPASNMFDTQAYLQARANAMGNGATVDDAIAAIKALKINPIQDYYDFGKAHNINPTGPADEIQPDVPAGWTQWGQGGGDTPAPDDPFDLNYKDVEITKDDTSYTGDNGQNTHFNAVWTNAADSTLSAGDVIKGGDNALNSLVVEMGNNWNGFNGVAVEGQFNNDPSVTNVGRIVLNHSEATSERTWTFNAENISDDAKQYDLNATGTGTFILNNLGTKVERVNISDIKAVTTGTGEATQLNFVPNAFSGRNDSLTIGVDNVEQNTISGPNGVEHLTFDAMGGTSSLDIASITGIKDLTVEGAGNLTVSAGTATSTIKTFNASEATGNVTFGVTGLTNQTITGGSGNDTVLILDGSNVSRANWSSIENVTFAGSGNATLNLRGVTGIENVWISTEGANTIKNLEASAIKVYQTKDADQPTAITTIDGSTKGSLGNLDWISSGDANDGTDFNANLSSNATGAATITVRGQSGLDTLQNGRFILDKASSVKIDAPNATDTSASLFLSAKAATALEIATAGSMTLTTATGGLDKVQNFTLNLTDENNTDDFTYSSSMKAAQVVNIDAGLENVTLGSLGDNTLGKDANPSLTLQVKDANMFTATNLEAGLGGDIKVNIAAEKAVTLGNIETSTNASANDQGDVSLVISNSAGGANLSLIKGGQLNVNLSSVSGGVTGSGITLNSTENIYYTGTDGTETVTVEKVGLNSNSSISLGDGVDNLTIDIVDGFFKAKTQSTINVDLGSDTDMDTINVSAADKGLLTVNVRGALGQDKVKVTDLIDDHDAIVKALKTFDLDGIVAEAGKLNADGTWTSGSAQYGVGGEVDASGNLTGGVVLVVLSGFEDIDAGGGIQTA